jgi:predicted GH43/DUF377 family glycosyl hydrolase
MRMGRVLLLAAALVCVAGVAMAQTEWVDDSANPVVPPPEPGAWDAERYLSSVIEVDGTYHMYFWGREDPAADPLYWYWDIGHATSPDGVTWVMDPANPVLVRGAAGEWDDHAAAFAAVIHDGSQFRMWYTGGDGEVGRVGYATSPDGSTWTKHPGNPVMDVGASGAFDDLGVWPGEVLFDGSRYRMWYTGAHGTISSDWDWRIGYAESDDGLSWIRHPAPVLEPAGWEGTIVYAPAVLFDGARYHMWYTAGGVDIGYAVSPDGIQWVRYFANPVVGNGMAHPAVLGDPDGGYEMWYTNAYDFSIRRATSACCSTMYASFIPAAAFAAGAHGSFFQTDLDLSNAGDQPVEYQLVWLPRGEQNGVPSGNPVYFTLGAGMSVRYANVLSEAFELEPDALGALAIVSSSPLLAMSRTYNLPGDGSSGTYGQSIPAVTAEEMIPHDERRRILFGTENAAMRTNVGCQNATGGVVPVKLELFDMEGTSLATETLVLLPWGNDQVNRIFADFAPITGYVEVWTLVTGGAFYCYGSVLDNVTSDPTTIPPM